MDLRFVYDGWNLVQEIDGLVEVESGVTDVVREYTWGLDLSGQSGNPSVGGIHGAGGIGGLLGTHWTGNTTSTSDDKAYIYFYDANGNVGQMIDHSGTTAAKYEYYPFGGLLVADGVAAAANPFRFSTKYRDNETGCCYYGYRYLRTKHGRWLSRDPIGESGSLNIQGSFSNNPISIIDFLGLDEIVLEFNAFIHKDTGLWFDEPTPSSVFHSMAGPFGTGWVTKGNNRGFGGGESKIHTRVRIDSWEIGSAHPSSIRWKTDIYSDPSIRRRFVGLALPGFSEPQEITETATAAPTRHEVFTTNGYCRTDIEIHAAASYPFFTLSPDIAIDLKWTIQILELNTVKIELTASHTRFPAMEGLVNGSLVASYFPSGESGPSLINLNTFTTTSGSAVLYIPTLDCCESK